MYSGALDDFTLALEAPQTSKVQTSAVLAYRGWMRLILKSQELALRDFELAIDLNDKNGDAYNGRGSVRVSLGEYANAAKDAEAAVEHGPPSDRLYYNATRIHAQCPGGEQSAVDCLIKTMALLPPPERPVFWSKVVQTDRSLDAIRRHPQYLQLEKAVLQRK
jgi:tetratricopeptide (TPR) repeat protein